jgi:hypothetical protein
LQRRFYFDKYPDELPIWEEFMSSAKERNSLETLGISGAVGVPELERPQELRSAGVSGSETRGGGCR